MNARVCTNPNCYQHEGETCPLGHLAPATECDAMKKGAPRKSAPAPSAIAQQARVPWSGSALGLDDLFLLASRARHLLIGVIGAHDSGKTTLLTANYLKILENGVLADRTFSGSWTLGAWESLAAWMRFQDKREPSFPPHTPRGTGRVPGMLHLALRSRSVGFRDVFFTDAPGEWFSRWAIKEDAPDAEGARWVVQHSDAFLIAADSERLSGANRGPARNELRQLLERLGNHIDGRPAVLVWTKSEHTVPDGIRRSITEALKANLPQAVELSSSVSAPGTFVDVIAAIVLSAWEGKVTPPIIEPVSVATPFWAFRGHHGQT